MLKRKNIDGRRNQVEKRRAPVCQTQGGGDSEDAHTSKTELHIGDNLIYTQECLLSAHIPFL